MLSLGETNVTMADVQYNHYPLELVETVAKKTNDRDAYYNWLTVHGLVAMRLCRLGDKDTVDEEWDGLVNTKGEAADGKDGRILHVGQIFPRYAKKYLGMMHRDLNDVFTKSTTTETSDASIIAAENESKAYPFEHFGRDLFVRMDGMKTFRELREMDKLGYLTSHTWFMDLPNIAKRQESLEDKYGLEFGEIISRACKERVRHEIALAHAKGKGKEPEDETALLPVEEVERFEWDNLPWMNDDDDMSLDNYMDEEGGLSWKSLNYIPTMLDYKLLRYTAEEIAHIVWACMSDQQRGDFNAFTPIVKDMIDDANDEANYVRREELTSPGYVIHRHVALFAKKMLSRNRRILVNKATRWRALSQALDVCEMVGYIVQIESKRSPGIWYYPHLWDSDIRFASFNGIHQDVLLRVLASPEYNLFDSMNKYMVLYHEPRSSRSSANFCLVHGIKEENFRLRFPKLPAYACVPLLHAVKRTMAAYGSLVSRKSFKTAMKLIYSLVDRLFTGGERYAEATNHEEKAVLGQLESAMDLFNSVDR